ncbi:MAG: endopeptidase La [Lentisphaeria bacterium]|jgi:ATP-dependent Lon protease
MAVRKKKKTALPSPATVPAGVPAVTEVTIETSVSDLSVAAAAAAAAAADRGGGKPQRLPVVPLRRAVLFPYAMTAMVIDQPEGVRLVDEAVARNRLVAIVPVDAPDGTALAAAKLPDVACAARIVKVLRFPDDTLRILVRGIRRLRLHQAGPAKPYPVATFLPTATPDPDSPEIQALVASLMQQFHQLLALSPTLPDDLKVVMLNLENRGRLADFLASNLNLHFAEKLELLRTGAVGERLAKLSVLLNRELELLKLGNEIQSKVSNTFGKAQREAFLREQLKTIQEQLGEEPESAEIAALRARLAEVRLPDEAKAAVERELEHLRKMHPMHGDYNVARTYVEWLLALPWATLTEDRLDLAAAARLLDAEHYGLRKVKDRILEFLAVRQLRGDARGSILCLAGPPGVGKTSFGHSIAKALGREFIRVSLGGIRDEAEIRGHRRTYVGALPGRIIQGLRRAKTANPVFMLDEIDKIGADFRGDPSAALLEALDPAQNSAFSDHYLEVPFDLSKVLFITTANLVDPILPALRDRLEILDLPGYTALEKREIARRFLLPRQLAANGLGKRQLALPDATLDALIGRYTCEAGVRNLERELGRLCRKAARRLVELPEAKRARQRFTITEKQLPGWLGPRRLFPEAATAEPLVGIATGLAWTSAGGDVLQIEATAFPGKGTLTLTGSLGEVMKESAQLAYSHLRGRHEELHIPSAKFESCDFHLHVPAGATPKDGPSAGVTLLTALASLLTGRPVKPFLAMTGELTLRGRVLPVGGIKEKALAAARAGVRTLILPVSNRQDLEEIPAEIRDALQFHFVHDAGEVLALALQD